MFFNGRIINDNNYLMGYSVDDVGIYSCIVKELGLGGD